MTKRLKCAAIKLTFIFFHLLPKWARKVQKRRKQLFTNTMPVSKIILLQLLISNEILFCLNMNGGGACLNKNHPEKI